MATNNAFGDLDIVVFVVSLVLSAAIGIFFAVKDRRKENVENYFYGGRKMSPVPVGFSIAVTFISAITVLALPSEAYLFGMVAIWYSFTMVVPTFVACVYYIPLIHRLRLNTIYQYLGLRFHPIVRKFTSAVGIINEMVYMGVILYLPALALSAVTPISITTSIIMTIVICTMYTTVGGLKAVIWIDTLQAAIMLIGSLSVIVQGTIKVGGIGELWKSIERSGRNNIWTFDLDPTIRTTFWTVMVGLSISQTKAACLNQSVCQRYLSCKSVRGARIAACTALFPNVVITMIAMCSGCVAYAYFEGCDPIKSKKIEKLDQMVPYLALEVFHSIPGMSGLFIAAAYSGTLSSVSSGIISLSSLFLEDFVVPLKPHMTPLTIGVLVAVIAFLFTPSSQTIVFIIFSIMGALEGPRIGLFTLGVFIPHCNAVGALIGQVVGTGFALWLALGGLINGKDPESQRMLPTYANNCTFSEIAGHNEAYIHISTNSYMKSTHWGNITTSTTTSIKVDQKSYNPIQAMSFMYYSLVGCVVTLTVSILVSACTGFRDPKKMNPRLFVPFIDNPLLPKSVVRFFRFGVPPLVDETKKENQEEEVNFRLVEAASGTL